MDEKPVISVIVPVYNAEEYLDDCISDILSQTYSNIELILVDDGSTDRSGALCENRQEQDPRIKTIHKKNGGVCEARNIGLENAAGKWIVFIDADDRVNESLLFNLLKVQEEKQADIVGTGYISFTGAIEASVPEEIQACLMNKRQYIRARNGEYICGALYKKSCIDQEGLRFDTNLARHEEVFWNSIYRLYCKRQVFIQPPLYYYRNNSHSLIHTRKSKETGVRDWLLARAALETWRSNHNLSLKQTLNLRTGEIHCEKNCFAECLSAGLNYNDFKKLCVSSGIRNAIWNSALYYGCFVFLLRIRQKIVVK